MSLTANQVRKRRNILGGSDIPSVLNVSPYKTRRQLKLEKMGVVESSIPQRLADRGNMLQPIVQKMWIRDTGIKFSEPKQTMEHPDHPWLVCHFDGLTKSKTELIETKTMMLAKYLKSKREGLPIDITSQVQTYLSWPKLKKAYVIVFSAELWEYFTVEMEPDREFQNIIFTEGQKFMDELSAGYLEDGYDAPTIDLPPASTGEVLKLSSPEFLAAISELREAEDILKEAQEIKDAAKAKILTYMGPSEVIEAEGVFRAYYRLQNGRKSFDAKSFSKDHPELNLAPYWKQGEPFRSFKPYFLRGEQA